MKKTFAFIAAAVILGTSAFAQKQNSDPLAALKSAATSMAESILGEVITQTVGYKLEGEWIYNGMASAIQTENALATIAASAYKENLDKKMNSYLSKVGIKPGVAHVLFNADGTFAITNGTRQIAGGNYTLEGSEVKMKFGKVYNYLSMTGTLSATLSGCQILFDADKFISFLGKTAKILKKKKASTNGIGAVAAQVNGLKLGFDLKK